jgi:hypothetical protein
MSAGILDNFDQVSQIGSQTSEGGGELLSAPESVKSAMEGQPMNQKIIAEAGRLLFGTRYVSDLSRALNVSRMTITAWLSPKGKMSERIVVDPDTNKKKKVMVSQHWQPNEDNVAALKALVKKRIEELRNLLKEMK